MLKPSETKRDELDALWFKSGWDAAIKEVSLLWAAGADLDHFLTEQTARAGEEGPR